jgi:asparagine synthase (glutamine-hydrolysing)
MGDEILLRIDIAMCGIVGIHSCGSRVPASEAELVCMRDSMALRGPDDAGVFRYQDEDVFVTLGHRRLSIIDLSSSGHQPMSTADKSLWITYNGEVFNFQGLRDELIATRKYAFQSKTDTEVILYGVREWGLEGCLKKIRGMYAFALFDALDGSLTLVRDPLGVKPLYYRQEQGLVAFASEIKAILSMPGVARRLNQNALYHYLTFANTPAPETLFAGIRKLEAGTYLKLDRTGNVKKVTYWDPTRFRPRTGLMDEEFCVQEVRRLLRQSVARRMVSDVPFGVFLSGGLDSSLNVALMAELMDRPVQTFSIGIEGDVSNEFQFAREVAQHFGANHHEVLINDRDFLEFLPRMAFLQDEPLADPVCVPLYYVSKLAREAGTIVIQVGEGSDEIFAGYGLYHFFNKWNHLLYQPYSHLPRLLKSSVHGLLKNRVTAHLSDALRRAARSEPLFLGNAIAFWDSEKKKLLINNKSSHETSGQLVQQLMNRLPSADPLSAIIQLELKNRLPELLLMRVDKMSMGNSIETRVPYLDEDLVEFALAIPSDLKFKNGRPKYVLKKAAEGIVPPEVIYRKKWGFCGSATNILSDRIVKYAYDRVHESDLMKGLFDKSLIEDLFQKHREHKRFNSFKIWNLMNLALWHECWFGGGEAPRTRFDDAATYSET